MYRYNFSFCIFVPFNAIVGYFLCPPLCKRHEWNIKRISLIEWRVRVTMVNSNSAERREKKKSFEQWTSNSEGGRGTVFLSSVPNFLSVAVFSSFNFDIVDHNRRYLNNAKEMSTFVGWTFYLILLPSAFHRHREFHEMLFVTTSSIHCFVVFRT